MKCPHCAGEASKVIEVRHTANGTRRRHLCLCGKKYTSYNNTVALAHGGAGLNTATAVALHNAANGA